MFHQHTIALYIDKILEISLSIHRDIKIKRMNDDYFGKTYFPSPFSVTFHLKDKYYKKQYF